MFKKKILFVVGSMNQTTQMHQISSYLQDDFDCYFTQFYPVGKFSDWLIKKGFFDKTIWAGKFKANSEAYLRANNLKIDYKAQKHNYDMVVMCTDMYIPENLRGKKIVWVQEGMVDPVTLLTKIVKKFNLPNYLTFDTSLNGTSNYCDVFFTASEGYSEHFAKWGTESRKLVATGIPNYDNAARFIKNDFPFSGYMMVATSDMRETMKVENRPAFLRECVRIAKGKRLLFKLHPNENAERAIKEIKEICPTDTLIYTGGNIDHMIANCDVLITQYSTVVYTGIALGKKVYSYLDVKELYRLCPVQNGGVSAFMIAEIVKQYANYAGHKDDFIAKLPMLTERIKAKLKEEELVAVA